MMVPSFECHNEMIVSYLLLNLNLQIIFHHVNHGIFAAGIQHPLPDATRVPRHGINEDCKAEERQ